MKTSREIIEIGIDESREEEEVIQHSEFLRKKWYSEEEIKQALITAYDAFQDDASTMYDCFINELF
jgi:hypothetical protein